MSIIPDTVSEHRKDIIKFTWTLLKSDDITVKQSAHVQLARFIHEYDTPSKIVTQMYVGQLRAHQLEGRALVRQALDTMITILPQRFAPSAQDQLNFPVWMQWIRKILIEDGHSVTQLVSIFQLLIRNPLLFFPCRKHFLLNIVQSLAKLGLSSNSSAETRLLTIELGGLLLKWHHQEVQESKSGEDEAMTGVESPGGNAKGYRDVTINYFVRFCVSLSDAQSIKQIFPRAIELLEQFLTVWPEATVQVAHFEKFSPAPFDNEASLNASLLAAEVLLVILECKSTFWICDNLPSINATIPTWLATDNPQMITTMSSIVKRIYAAIDEQSAGMDTDQVSVFCNMIDTVVSHGMLNLVNINGVKSLLHAAYLNRKNTQAAAQKLKPHNGELIKLLQAILTDSANQASAAGPADANSEILKDVLILLGILVSFHTYQSQRLKLRTWEIIVKPLCSPC
jgi:transformation/transcription domain-associated protein